MNNHGKSRGVIRNYFGALLQVGSDQISILAPLSNTMSLNVAIHWAQMGSQTSVCDEFVTALSISARLLYIIPLLDAGVEFYFFENCM